MLRNKNVRSRIQDELLDVKEGNLNLLLPCMKRHSVKTLVIGFSQNKDVIRIFRRFQITPLSRAVKLATLNSRLDLFKD